MKVTGHASASMVASYDKTSQEINATEKIQLVNQVMQKLNLKVKLKKLFYSLQF